MNRPDVRRGDKMPHSRCNLAITFWRAGPSTRAEGLEWYTDANCWAASTAREHGLGIDQVVGILAALSPATSWDANKRDTLRIIAEPGTSVTTWAANAAKARRILSGESPEQVLRGPKVTAFYWCILEPHVWHLPVVDRHIIHCAAGRVLTNKERGPYHSAKSVQQIQADIIRIAEDVYLLPADVQAIIWLTHKKVHHV